MVTPRVSSAPGTSVHPWTRWPERHGGTRHEHRAGVVRFQGLLRRDGPRPRAAPPARAVRVLRWRAGLVQRVAVGADHAAGGGAGVSARGVGAPAARTLCATGVPTVVDAAPALAVSAPQPGARRGRSRGAHVPARSAGDLHGRRDDVRLRVGHGVALGRLDRGARGARRAHRAGRAPRHARRRGAGGSAARRPRRRPTPARCAGGSSPSS